MTDLETLAGLNRGYIAAVQHGDARRFDAILADVWARRDGRWLAVSAHVTR